MADHQRLSVQRLHGNRTHRWCQRRKCRILRRNARVCFHGWPRHVLGCLGKDCRFVRTPICPHHLLDGQLLLVRALRNCLVVSFGCLLALHDGPLQRPVWDQQNLRVGAGAGKRRIGNQRHELDDGDVGMVFPLQPGAERSAVGTGQGVSRLCHRTAISWILIRVSLHPAQPGVRDNVHLRSLCRQLLRARNAAATTKTKSEIYGG
mmetsp:Transcript_23234/g.64797  ORF Transcript_23234/g.64797 Transcript_23234/m.64797 type:complete len:206 (+) Transcript_23234:249-866(+)